MFKSYYWSHLFRKASRKLNNAFQTVWERYVIHQYVKTGLIWGEMTSYDLLGTPYGYGELEKDLNLIYWEGKYEELGYKPVKRIDWVDAGGYGRPYEHLLRISK